MMESSLFFNALVFSVVGVKLLSNIGFSSEIQSHNNDSDVFSLLYDFSC